jgi:hypothetical protein
MTDSNLRVRSVSEIVDAAFSLYRRHAKQYITIAAIATAPSLIINLLLGGGVEPITPGDFIRMVPGVIIGLVTFALVSAVIVRMGSDVYLGGDPDVAATLQRVLPRVPALLASIVLTMVMVTVAALFLLLPSLYVVAVVFATVPVIVVERLGPLAAVSRSASLSKNIKLHILGTLVLVYGVYFGLAIGIPILTLLVGNPVIQLVVQSLLGVVSAPILNLVVMVLYYDARIRAEGFDVEHMAQSLGTSPVAS